MISSKNYNPSLFSGKFTNRGIITVYSKDRNVLPFMLNDGEKCKEFEKITGYSLDCKNNADLACNFRVNLVRIEMDTETKDGSEFYYCKMTVSLQDDHGKCYDMVVFKGNFNGKEKEGFCWNMKYGSCQGEKVEPEFYYR